MTPTEHMVAWIESSQPHYLRLCTLEIERKAKPQFILSMSRAAFELAASAYAEATVGGDMFASDWTPADLLDAAKALLEWELEA